MGQLLASDLNNPEFAGATNPDGRLAVQFYSRPVQNEFESQKQGRPIFFDQDFVKIFVPGDPTSVIDTPAREDHKQRFPMHWAHYQNKHGGDAREIGTPLSHWSLVTASQAEELRALKFFTVESISNASDAQLQRIGMVAGMSPYAFRDRAKNYLRLASAESESNEAEEKVKQLQAENAALKAEFDEKLETLRNEMMAKKKPGRKKKEIAAE